MYIRKLFLSAEDERSNEYKTGWNDAVCYLHQVLEMKKRDGEEISIVITIDEDAIIEEIKKDNSWQK